LDSHLKSFCALFVLTIITVLAVTQMPVAHSEELTVQQKSQAFLTNVAQLNLAQYNIQVNVFNYSTLTLFNQEVLYNLTSAESKLTVICLFRQGNLVWCKLYPTQGLPKFATPAIDPLSSATNVIDRYQNFSAATYLSPMRNMLVNAAQLSNITSNDNNVIQQASINGNTTSIVTNTTSSIGSISQAVTIQGNTENIEWTSPVNGIENLNNYVYLTVQNGNFEFLCDNWNLYKVGSATVNVQRDEAIQLALQAARAYSWTVNNQAISNFTVLSDPVLASLSMHDRGNYTLYPYWNIMLPLDKVYPGGVDSIRVLLWGDTGQVDQIIELGGGGAPSTNATTSPSQSPNEQNMGAASSSVSWPTIDCAIVAALIATIAAVSGCLLYKRRR